jgi:pilus assembly protein CpaE
MSAQPAEPFDSHEAAPQTSEIPPLPAGAVLAFIIDDETAAVAQSALGGDVGDPLPLHRVAGGFQAALSTPDMPPGLAALLVDIADTESAVSDLAALVSTMPPECAVLAIGDANDVTLFRDLLGAGAADYLVRPLHPGVMRKAIDTALAGKKRERELSEARSKLEQIGSGNVMVTTDPSVPARVVAVVGARGGVGASTVATSIASMVSTMNKSDVLILDLDLHYGSVMLSLDLDPSDALREALTSPERVDNLFIEQSVQRKGEFLCALGAEDPPNTPVQIEKGVLSQLVAKFQRKFNFIVLDVPRGDPVMQQQAFECATDIVVVGDLTLTGVRDGMRLLNFITECAPRATIFVLAGGSADPRKSPIRIADLEKSIKRKVDGQVAYDEKALAGAVNTGVPVPEAAPRSPIVKSLQPLVKEFRAPESAKGSAPKSGAKQSLFGQLFAGKPKKK